MRRGAAALVPLALTACAAPRSERARADEAAALAVLSDQAVAWNRGDLDGYMRGYVDSPDLTFFSGGSGTAGYGPVLERYRQRYATEGREMGRLAFEDLRFESLGADAGFVRGRFRLRTSEGETTGLFTLVLRRTAEGWRIVHDHTSV